MVTFGPPSPRSCRTLAVCSAAVVTPQPNWECRAILRLDDWDKRRRRTGRRNWNGNVTPRREKL